MTTTANDTNVSVPTQRVISQEDLQQHLREFKVERGTDFSLTQIGYVGSYARQEARPDSDVDIIFQTTQPNFLITAVMKQELEQWLNRSVDLIRLHPYLHPAFRERLDREAIYV